MKPYEGKHETLPHEYRCVRCLVLCEATKCGQEGETAPDNGSPVWAVAGMVTVVAVAISLSTLEHT